MIRLVSIALAFIVGPFAPVAADAIPFRDIGPNIHRLSENAGPGMTLKRIREISAKSTERCVNAVTNGSCDEELDYALNNQLMSVFAHKWARTNGFYPVIDRRNVIQAVCKCGCFAADTAILTRSGELEVSAIVPGLEVVSIAQIGDETPRTVTESISGVEHADLYAFSLESGRVLRVTQNHPVVVGDGRMLAARNVKPQDGLLTVDGRIASIVAIRREPASSPVHNFSADATDAAGHVVVAEGVLVGDLIWQNQLARELGAIIIRQ